MCCRCIVGHTKVGEYICSDCRAILDEEKRIRQNKLHAESNIERIDNPFILAGYNAVQAAQLYEFASKYQDVGINANEAAQVIINATRSTAKLRNELEKIGDNIMSRERIKTQIEEWFCDANIEDGMFSVAELYALLYSEAKRNLRYWSDEYVKVAADE